MKTALIIGATGLVGGYCLRELLNDTEYDKVIALTRKPLSIKHPKLLNEVVDFDQPKTYAGLCKADVVFSTMGTTIGKAGSKEAFSKVDFTYPTEVAIAAKQNGANTHVLVSAMGADSGSPFFYNKVKGKLEEAITAMGFATNIILHPSLLLGERNERRVMEKISQDLFRKASFLFQGPLEKYKGVERETVAKAMVGSAKKKVKGTIVVDNKEILTYANH